MVICVAFTSVAVCAVPLKVTVELEEKFVPLMVNVCAAAPAAEEAGEILAMLGMGLLETPAPPEPQAVI